MATLTPGQLATLTALADGIIPADDVDGGAAVVNAGVRLGERIAAGVNAPLYLRGLDLAQSVAGEKYHLSAANLSQAQVHELLGHLREVLPAFFKQLRMDVSALYLGDPDVWRRIGFPGPSTVTGGYPDFAGPQTTTYAQIDAGRRPADASQDDR